MASDFINAMFDLGRAISDERSRLYSLACSADDMGFEKLADRISEGMPHIEALWKRMQELHGQDQAAEIRGHEELMGNVLVALLDRASTTGGSNG